MPLIDPEILREIDEATRGLGEIRRRLAGAGFRDVDDLLAQVARLNAGLGSFAGAEVDALLERVRTTVAGLHQARAAFEELARIKRVTADLPLGRGV